MASLSTRQVLRRILTEGATPNIGQITPEIAKSLNRLVRAGRLATYRGHWDTLLPNCGIGPLKTIYALPETAAVAMSFAASFRKAA